MLKTEVSPRIDKLREIYYNGPVFKEYLSYRRIRRQLLVFYRAYLNDEHLTTRLRKAYAEGEVLSRMKPVIDDCELIVGKADFSPLTQAEQEELDSLSAHMQAAPKTRGLGGHMVLDYPKLLHLGVEGILKEINELREGLDVEGNAAENLPKLEFYEACEAELRGLLKLAKNYAVYAHELADKEQNADRKKELLEIAKTLECVPAKPAKSFREALQSIHFYHFCLWDGYHYGRVDQYLLPYYKNDVKCGRLTREKAQELIDCFRLIAVGYMHPDTAINVMVGGRDPKGNFVENELTEMFLQSIEHIGTMHKVEFAITKETSEDLLKYAIELNARGYTLPTLLNDDAITEGMRLGGFSEEDSHNWATTGCVELTPIGKSGIFVVSPYHNMPQMLLEAMKTKCTDFDELFDKFKSILRREIISELQKQNLFQLERSRNAQEVMRVSCLVDDCLKRGKSVDEGGAVYNNIQPNFLGLANVADSLVVLNELVFRAKEYTLEEFTEILDNNFEGQEDLRQRILKKIPHYGTNNAEADAMVQQVLNAIEDACKGLSTFRGSTLSPGVFSYLEHSRHGLNTGATPDGRKAGCPFSSGSSPTQGRETDGPTSALLSATSWNHKPFLGGVAINLKFGNNLNEEVQEKMLAMLKVFLERGGFQLQINAVSSETMRKAQENPEEYRDLIVRVGGFSANFVTLSPETQMELIERNEHRI